MYFAVVKLTFESDSLGARDRKELHALCEKIRARYKVSVAAAASEEDDAASVIAIAALASSQEKLSQLIDGISEFCETSGFGRIESEDALMDHIDAVGDDQDD